MWTQQRRNRTVAKTRGGKSWRSPLTSDFSLKTRKKSVLHHFRHVANHPLTQTRDWSAGFDGAAHVDDRCRRVGPQRDRGIALDESRFALPFNGEPIAFVGNLLGDLHSAFVASRDRGERHCQ